MPADVLWPSHELLSCLLTGCSLHRAHDEEKPFEAELAWVCEDSGRVFQRVPQDLVDEAERHARATLEAEEMYVCLCVSLWKMHRGDSMPVMYIYNSFSFLSSIFLFCFCRED